MIAYVEKFLALLERFVVAAERRNELMANQTSHTIISDSGVKTTLAQDVDTAEKQVSAAESTQQQSPSNGSASDAATGRGVRGRTRAAVAGTETAGAQTAEASPAETAPTAPAAGRRQRVRAADVTPDNSATEKEAAGTESTAGATTGVRRQRTRAAEPAATETHDETIPEPVNDSAEQADARAEMESLIALCGDVDAASADVKAYFKNNGWNGASEVPSHQVEDALTDVNEIVDKYFD